MRTAAIALLLVTMCLTTAHCATEGKVTLDAQNVPIKDVVAQLSQQSQAAIVLDPKADCNVTVSLTSVDLGQALDVITKLNKLTWKKVSFALPDGDTAKLEQIKSAVLALASIPVTGLMVDDPATKQSAVMAKNLPAAPETTAVKLPEGYSWKTFYVITPPIVAAPAAPASQSKLAELTAGQAKTLQELAALTPEERQQYYANEIIAQMTLTPEARQALMRDRMQAMHNLDPQYRDQMRQDMHAAFGGNHPDFGGRGGRAHSHGNANN